MYPYAIPKVSPRSHYAQSVRVRTSHGTGFARILFVFSSKKELETNEMDIVAVDDEVAAPDDGDKLKSSEPAL